MTTLIKVQNRSGQALTFNIEGRMRHLPPGAGAVMAQDSIGPEIRMLLTEGILEASSMAPSKAPAHRDVESEAFGADSGTSRSERHERPGSKEHERAKHDKSGKGKER